MKHRTRRILFAPALAIALALAGCAAKVPPTSYYELGADLTRSEEGSGARIGVRDFAVDPPFDQDKIVYRDGVGSPRVGFYHYHRWAAPVGEMVAHVVADALRGARGAGIIEPRQPGRRYDAFLGGRVMRLEEVDDGTSFHVVIELRLHLETADGREIWSHHLVADAESSSDEVQELVRTLDTVLAERLGSARDDLAGALSAEAFHD